MAAKKYLNFVLIEHVFDVTTNGYSYGRLFAKKRTHDIRRIKCVTQKLEFTNLRNRKFCRKPTQDLRQLQRWRTHETPS